MKNLKKVLSVLLVVAMLAVTMVPAFAAESATISADAKICSDIGMLIGEGAGVTADYTSTTPTRAQAAVMLLRLKGLAADAAKFEGKDNFADVEDMEEWFVPYAAYLKATPTVGFVGVEDGKFAADLKITAQEYYKVVLTALGYEVGAGKDYEYDKTLEFAATKGLKLVADAKEFTVGNVATATVEALNATVKGGTKTLATVLVEAGKLDAVKAEAAGLYTKYAALDVKSVAGYTNTKVKVTLNTAVTAVDASKFSVKDSAGTAVAVKEVKLSSDGLTVFVVTDALAGYSKYTLTVADKSFDFVGMPADATKPEVKSALVNSDATITVEFTEAVDAETATNVANYTFDNGLTAVAATIKDDVKVILTTSAQTVGTVYKITIQNVTDLAGNAMDKNDKNYFGGVVDTDKPTVKSVVVNADATLTIEFTENVDAASAGSVANYTFDNGLTALTATVKDAKVTLITSAQTVGTVYKVTIQNVKDKAGNVMDKDDKNYFGGVVDTDKPTVKSVVVNADSTVAVTFTENVDAASAASVANYTFDNGLTALTATVKDAKVTLTTSAQTVGTVYKITIQNVKDKAGNVMDKDDKNYFGGVVDTDKPTVPTISSGDKTVTLVFDNPVDKATAEYLLNYSFDGDLGYAIKAKLADDGVTLTLTTAPQTPGKIYNVTINNIKDKVGNVIDTNYKKQFAGMGSIGATEVKLQAVTAVNVNTIDLIFSAEPNIDSIAFNVYKKANNEKTEITVLTAYPNKQSDKKIVRVQFTKDGNLNPSIFSETGVVYEVKVTGVTNLVTKDDANVKVFGATATKNAEPTVTTIIPVNSTAVKVIFSKPVKGIISSLFSIKKGDTVVNISGDQLGVDGNTKLVSEVVLNLSDKLEAGPVYKLTVIGSGITDIASTPLKIADANLNAIATSFAGTNLENAAPKIQTVIPVDKYNFKIVYNELVNNGKEISNYKLEDVTDSTPVTVSFDGAKIAEDGVNYIVSLDKAVELKAGRVYRLTYLKAVPVTDKQGVEYSDASGAEKVTFAGNSLANAQPTIVSVTTSVYEVGKATEITVKFSEKVYGTVDSATFTLTIDAKPAAYTVTITDGNLTAGKDTVKLTLSEGYVAGKQAKIKVATGSSLKDINGQDSKTDEVQFGTR